MKISIDPGKLAPVLAAIYRAWVATLRFETHGSLDEILKRRQDRKPLVLALWHGEIFPVTGFGHTISSDLVTFVSQSRDGEVIARIIERLGHVTVRGSSSRGGVKALLQAVRIMAEQHRMGVFTVDGPRGPRHKPKGGVIYLAQKAGAAIVPLRAYPERAKVFTKSWDHFVLPMPFSRCPVYVGKPMEVTDEKLTETVLARELERLEQRMLALGPQEPESAR
ncbi:lysophospholipid acyltransferase family protein [Pseudodesulfovibrio pelocollis]|uniref:lysophospholipid acyltransferase family protein n=1 Tax=Pseudodesulfovibrio pelocollis TaxID=3051432 RepID=UPI00255A81A1|nr:lysophospholipid acyltransferase family protein [Pseudodesulfovibrio sp. SB368]